MFDSKKRMIETMQLFGLKESTQKIYSHAIENIAKTLNKRPEELIPTCTALGASYVGDSISNVCFALFYDA